MTRRTFLKIVGGASAALYVGAVSLKLVKECPLCAEGFAHYPASSSFSCRWLEINQRYGWLPESWRRS